MDRKTQLLAQFFISVMMAIIMTGIFTFIPLGPTPEWLQAWPRQFLVAWPIAFCLSLFIGPLGFLCAFKVLGRYNAWQAKASQ